MIDYSSEDGMYIQITHVPPFMVSSTVNTVLEFIVGVLPVLYESSLSSQRQI